MKFREPQADAVLKGLVRRTGMSAARLADETYQKAAEVLKGNCGEEGIRASDRGYNEVWCRDSFITFIGANMLGEAELLKAAKNTLLTLGRSKSELGQIPVNYDLGRHKAMFFIGGAVDSASLYIIGLANLYSVSGDRDLLNEALDHAIDAYRWLRYQDSRNIMLIDSQPGADWMDNTLKREGITLYNNVLFLAATKCINRLCDISGKGLGDGIRLDYDSLERNFNEVFAPGEEAMRSGSWLNLGDYKREYFSGLPEGKLRYHPQFVTMNRVDMHFDTLSNLAAIAMGISTPDMASSIISYIGENRLADPYPIRVMHPNYGRHDQFFDGPFTRAKPRDVRNSRYCFHNGGVWPFVGGFYVMALKDAGSPAFERELERLAAANSLIVEGGRLGFNEWIHGRRGVPMGKDGQSWSAGMYIAAYMASSGTDPFGFLKNINNLS
jgi:glycogen debranching enzyme